MTFILSIIFFLAFLLCPSACASGTEAGLLLSVTKALPSLFPFFITGNLLIRTGSAYRLSKYLEKPISILYHLPKSAVPAIILGLLGGYPVGAVSVSGLLSSGALCKKDAEYVISFCNCASPGFCISLIGVSLFGNAKIGAILYIIHAASALIVGIFITRNYKSSYHLNHVTVPKCQSFTAAFCGAVEDAAKTGLIVTAFLTCFSIILSLLAPVLHLIPFAPILSGLLDLTYGISTIGDLHYSVSILLPIISFLLGFGGLAVHCQAHAIAAPHNLSMKKFTIAKLLHGFISALLTILLLRFFPEPISVFFPAVKSATPHFYLAFKAIAVVLLCLLPICSRKNQKNTL